MRMPCLVILDLSVQPPDHFYKTFGQQGKVGLFNVLRDMLVTALVIPV
jgi:hypothetical protein